MLDKLFGMTYYPIMRTKQAIEHFGTITALAKAINVRKQSIYSWKEIVPFARQLQLQEVTRGKLKAMTWAEFIAHKEAA